MVRGSSSATSAPSREKYGCFLMWVITYRSPAGPPDVPCSPLPLNRILPPSVTPAGICTVRGFTRTTRPLPLHVLHGSSITLPEPPQRLHVLDTPNRPWPCETAPVPWHTGHMVGPVPGLAPLPWHVGQVSTRWTSTLVETPLSASSNVRVTS